MGIARPYLVLALAAACAPAPSKTRSTVAPPARQEQGGPVRRCAMTATPVPDVAINFDLFVANGDELASVFPGSLLPRSEPRSMKVSEIREPSTGRVVAGPFEPPLFALSFEPDGPWPDVTQTLDLQAVGARKLPWIECAGLFPDGFEALGDALDVPPPVPNDLQRALAIVPDRLTVALYPPPDSAHSVMMFPAPFQSALADVKDAKGLGRAWSNAFRARRLRANDSARAAGFRGRDEPPPDAERLRPYFIGLASDILPLAEISVSTTRNLYLHVWPD